MGRIRSGLGHKNRQVARITLARPNGRKLAVTASFVVVLVIVAGLLAARAFYFWASGPERDPNERAPWMKLRFRSEALSRAHKFSAADSVLDLAIRLAAGSLGPEHADVAKLMERKAACLYELGREAASESVMRQVLAMREHLGSQASEMDADLGILGMIVAKQGRYAEAESLLLRAERLADTSTDLPREAHADYLGRIGMLRLAQGDYAGAETLLLQAAEGYQASGDVQPQLPIVLDSLAAVYSRTGRGVKAESLRRAR